MKHLDPALCGQEWIKLYKLISRRIRNRIRKYFRFNLGPRGNLLTEKPRVNHFVTLSLKQTENLLLIFKK
jgi:hypothetical protein